LGGEAMSLILKLDKDDEDRELEFELDYQRTLTTQQRFDMMFRGSRLMAEAMARQQGRPRGPGTATEIIKRSQDQS
jgi:hypothetical protein